MSRIITLNFGEDFIAALGRYLQEHYWQNGKDLNRVAVVFGGKRPALFVKRELAKRRKAAFYPPHFFSIDDFVTMIIRQDHPFQPFQDLEACYTLYELAKVHCPTILRGRETFAQFMPWTRELLAFIDQLDLENVSDDHLRNIKANAQIGYAVPDEINSLLEHVLTLRNVFHDRMQKNKTYSRGFQYLLAGTFANTIRLSEFDEIIFCNFFYLNASEAAVLKSFNTTGQGTFIFQGDEDRWPTLKQNGQHLGGRIQERHPQPLTFDLKLYSAFDGHSQVMMAKEIAAQTGNMEKTVIVLPDPDHIIPLVAEVSPLNKDFNISMGYPLKRSSVYALLEAIFKAQLSRDPKDGRYYTRDYLHVLRHPLVKNLNLGDGAIATRMLIHKIEDVLTGTITGHCTGHLFISLDQLCSDENVLPDDRKILTAIHTLVFQIWESIKTFADLAQSLGYMMTLLNEKSFLAIYPLNRKIVERILNVKEEIEQVSFLSEPFTQEDLFKIFTSRIEHEIHHFSGSPLKGLQILGLFETRSLNFDHVIVLDANEGVLPRLNVFEPLIPREVMVGLGLDRVQQEEEIQRYQFMRLIAAAKTVHLIYEESEKKEKSRFVEELVWEQEQRQGRVDIVPIQYPTFSVQVQSTPTRIKKTPAMVAFLKKYRYSASSLGTYLRSPRQFYFNYVLGLQEKEDLLEEPENRQVGTFIHELLEGVFKRFIGHKPVVDDPFRHLFQKALDEKFAAIFGKGRSSDAFLLKTVLDSRLARFLDFEAQRFKNEIAKILYIEKKFEDQIQLPSGTYQFAYRVDRVDQMVDGTIMIIDYKTGSVDPMPKAIEEIETLDLSREEIRDRLVSFQIPLYYHYLSKTFKDQPINAAYYNLRTLDVNRFIDAKMSFDPQRIQAAFLRSLDFILSEICDPQVPFRD